MMDEIWQAEETWWTMGAAEARRRMHPAALMVFGTGILQGEAILAGIDSAPRWETVEMADRHASETDSCAVLSYRAVARRADGTRHEALCSSTWLRHDDGWHLIQHQQTAPAPATDAEPR